jgi:hypothetical protein
MMDARTVSTTARRRRVAVVSTFVIGLFAAIAASGAPGADSDLGPVAVTPTASSTIAPDAPSAVARPAAKLSPAELNRMQRRIEARREAAMGVAGKPVIGSPVGTEAPDSPATALPGSRASRANLVIRNNKNTQASAVGSTLAEPSAANDSTQALYGGNTYLSTSTNSGSTWAAATIPAGPADAPTACCDLDAVHHAGLDTTFHTVLYTNAALTNGVVRIFVRQGTISGGVDCSYTIDPGGTGTMLPDYPHIGVSNGFVYLTMNLINGSGSWAGAQVRRFNASQMSSCVTASTNTFTHTGTVGQRVLTPAEGATTTMYFGSNESSSVFRIFRWPESSTAVSQFTRTLSHASNFTNPDCRGGTGNFDYIERSTSWSIAGFRLRGAVSPGNRVWFLWNAGPDSSHVQAHLNSAIFTDSSSPTTLASPAVFNQGLCFGYPAISAKTAGGFGEFGLTLAYGGKAGGAGAAAQGAITVDDSASSGNHFAALTKTASGTHNRSDSRFGDYFTIRNNDKCSTTGWTATNYSLLSGTATANVNARYVEFQSSTHPACP